jgi:hypothetical protein
MIAPQVGAVYGPGSRSEKLELYLFSMLNIGFLVTDVEFKMW